MSGVSSGIGASAGTDRRLKRRVGSGVAVIRSVSGRRRVPGRPQASMRHPMPREAAIRLSVVVVTYDSGPAVRRSLPALQAQLQPGDELIVFDNASHDGTA